MKDQEKMTRHYNNLNRNDMLQDPNTERYVENAIKPLKKEIAKLKLQIEELNKALRIHGVSGRVCCLCDIPR